MFVINNHINKHKYASHYHYKNIITKKLVHELLLFQSRYIETDHSNIPPTPPSAQLEVYYAAFVASPVLCFNPSNSPPERQCSLLPDNMILNSPDILNSKFTSKKSKPIKKFIHSSNPLLRAQLTFATSEIKSSRFSPICLTNFVIRNLNVYMA